MTKRVSLPILLGTALCLGTVVLASASLAPPGAVLELKQKASAHKKVGEMMGDCISAALKREGKRDAEEELREYLEKKWAKASKGSVPLSLSDDLAASLWYATNFSKAKGVKKGRVNDLTVEVTYYGDYVAENVVWTPKKYSPKKSYPIIFCIPDVDEKPQEHLDTHWASSAVREGAILIALDMPDDPDTWGGKGVQNDAEQAGGYGILFQTFSAIRDVYAMDASRVYIAGRGAGVAAAMEIANTSPDRFAGIIGRTGDAAELDPMNLSNMPCFFAGAGSRATAYAEKCKEAGYAEITVEPAGTEQGVWTWLLETPRISNPGAIYMRPGQPSRKAYWLEVPNAEYQESATLSAKADRDTNTITVEAVGVEKVTIYFNDSIVDMDQPIVVIINGKEHKDMIPRNFYSMMEQIYRGRSDSGKLYTAFKSYDVPAAPATTDE